MVDQSTFAVALINWFPSVIRVPLRLFFSFMNFPWIQSRCRQTESSLLENPIHSQLWIFKNVFNEVDFFKV